MLKFLPMNRQLELKVLFGLTMSHLLVTVIFLLQKLALSQPIHHFVADPHIFSAVAGILEHRCPTELLELILTLFLKVKGVVDSGLGTVRGLSHLVAVTALCHQITLLTPVLVKNEIKASC